MRMRLLLLKQNKLTVLEQELAKVDASEERAIFLGSLRRDTNFERLKIIQELEIALKSYDDLLERSRHIMDMPDPGMRYIQSLRNWTSGNGCIDRKETAYLAHSTDLASIRGHADGAITCLGPIVENLLVMAYKFFNMPLTNNERYTCDPRVLLDVGSALKPAVLTVIAWVVLSILLIPIALLHRFDRFAHQFSVIGVATAMLVAVLLLLSRAQMTEVIIAGATYVHNPPTSKP